MAIPADPNDGSLLSSIFLSSDNKAHAAARDLWAMTGLPEPEHGEFFKGGHADRVYLSSHGVCFSFVYRRRHLFNSLAGLFGGSQALNAPVFAARHIRDDRILQPLLQVDLGDNCCFEIVPGVERVGADRKTVKSLARALKGDKIDFYAPEPEFVGQMRLPGTGDQISLIVNRRSVRPLSDAPLFFAAQDSELQHGVYGPLRERFAQAWDCGSGAAFESALAECAKIAGLPAEDDHKILHAHWDAQGPQTYRRTQIVQSAREYAQRLVAA